MSSILNMLTDYFDRDLCASDDCVSGGSTSTSTDGGKSPLVDIAIGEWSYLY
jgi:hypothetical protein